MESLYPIWRKLASGRFYSDSAGAARSYDLDVQDFALLVNGVVYSMYITGRSWTNAIFSLEHWHGPTRDVNAFRLLSTPFAATQLNANPWLLAPMSGVAATSGFRLPFFRPRVVADSAVGQEDWWEGEIWAGGWSGWVSAGAFTVRPRVHPTADTCAPPAPELPLP